MHILRNTDLQHVNAKWTYSSILAYVCWTAYDSFATIYFFLIYIHHHHHHHIHFRALFSSTEGWAFWQVSLEGVLSTQNDSEGQQNPYLASFCHSQALHPMIFLACQIFSVQPHSACVLLQSSLCCALHDLCNLYMPYINKFSKQYKDVWKPSSQNVWISGICKLMFKYLSKYC